MVLNSGHRAVVAYLDVLTSLKIAAALTPEDLHSPKNEAETKH